MAKRRKSSSTKSKISRRLNSQLKKLLMLALTLLISALLAKYTVLDRQINPIGEISGRVVKVADGDTITVLTAGLEEVKVRLYGIDAPESKQAFGSSSASQLSSLVWGKSVVVEIVEIDRYNRSVGRVTLGDLDVNQEMVLTGNAWVYDSYCKISQCAGWKDLQASAKAQRKGLWRDKNPTPPWKWRKKNS
ncbi:endonuclease YncB(thermonuclease family) [Elusimicrobium posterum]|uniref:thermonuclease family protein n=1 Tax=Elusimicrobium posterum TaxID=3116653 RepID=UPI003C729E2A